MLSNAQIDEGDRVTRVLEQVTPFLVIARARFSRDNFRTLLLESCNPIADLNQHGLGIESGRPWRPQLRVRE
jgi:hypothetical protein